MSQNEKAASMVVFTEKNKSMRLLLNCDAHASKRRFLPNLQNRHRSFAIREN
jgi:hypothetical protein